MNSIMTSLMVDNSTTICAMSLNLLTKLLPLFAAHAREELKLIMSPLFAILARVMCWKESAAAFNAADLAACSDLDDSEGEVSPTSVVEVARTFDIRPELEWQRLDHSFNLVVASPSPQRLFTCVYYLFPCNLIAFLRRPSGYLAERSTECPYVCEWEEVLDDDQIKTKSQVGLRLPFRTRRVVDFILLGHSNASCLSSTAHLA
jgi:hypothetical protein